MSDTCYKAVRPDGTDWYSGTVQWDRVGEVVAPQLPDNDHHFPGPGWLHLATVPTECVGMRWPCRLFEVEPVGDVHRSDRERHKIGCKQARVIRELPAHQVFGPHGEQVVALIERAGRLTSDETDRLYAAWVAAGYAARVAAGYAARVAAGYAARAAAGYAARDAAGALIVADLVGQHGLTQEHIDTLIAPWREVIGDPLEARNE